MCNLFICYCFCNYVFFFSLVACFSRYSTARGHLTRVYTPKCHHFRLFFSRNFAQVGTRKHPMRTLYLTSTVYSRLRKRFHRIDFFFLGFSTRPECENFFFFFWFSWNFFFFFKIFRKIVDAIKKTIVYGTIAFLIGTMITYLRLSNHKSISF